MPVYRNGGFIEDDWIFVAEPAEIPNHGRIALSKPHYLVAREKLIGRNEPFGVVLQAGETLAGLEADLPRIGLIVLHLPKFNDGRLYSIARLARERYGFTGEIRASGEVLRDQIAFLHRAGVDSFDVTHEGTIAALRENKVQVVRRHYQNASRESEEAYVGRWPRERLSPPGAIPGTKA